MTARRGRRKRVVKASPDTEEEMLAKNQEMLGEVFNTEPTEEEEEEEEELPPRPKRRFTRKKMRFFPAEERALLEEQARAGEIEIIEDEEEPIEEPRMPSLGEFHVEEVKFLTLKHTLIRAQVERVKSAVLDSLPILQFLSERDLDDFNLDGTDVHPLVYLRSRAQRIEEDSTILKELAATILVLTRSISDAMAHSQVDGEDD